MPADACIAFGGEVVAFCPVSSSSSSLASSSSLLAVVSSSSGISDNSSSSNAVLSSSSSSETPAVPSSSSVVLSSSSSAIPVVSSSSSAMPSSSSSGFYDLGDVTTTGDIERTFKDIADSAEDGDCVYISFNWLNQYFYPSTLTLICSEWEGPEIYCDGKKTPIDTGTRTQCSFNNIIGINLWYICLNKRSSRPANCWVTQGY